MQSFFIFDRESDLSQDKDFGVLGEPLAFSLAARVNARCIPSRGWIFKLIVFTIELGLSVQDRSFDYAGAISFIDPLP